MPLNDGLRKHTECHWMFFDDMKLFAKNEKELENLKLAVRIFTDDVWMEFGKEKCAKLIMRCEKLLMT